MKINIREVRMGRKLVIVLDCDGLLTMGAPCVFLREQVNSVIKKGPGKVLLNMEKVTVIDYEGLDELVRSYTSAREGDIKLRIACIAKGILRLLETHKLQTILLIPGTLEEAIDSIIRKRDHTIAA